MRLDHALYLLLAYGVSMLAVAIELWSLRRRRRAALTGQARRRQQMARDPSAGAEHRVEPGPGPGPGHGHGPDQGRDRC